MRIGILSYVLRKKYCGGIKTYLYNIIKELEKIDNENEYFLYVPSKDIELPFKSNPRWHVRICRGFINQSGTLWQFFNAKNYLLKDKIDIFWATENILSCNLNNTNIKRVLNIHDLMWLEYFTTFNLLNLFFYWLFGKKSYSNADCILTGTIASKKKIESFFGYSKSIKPIYHGVAELFKPLNKEESQYYCKSKFGLSPNYILCVSVLKPTKNIEGLLKAFKVFKNTYKTKLQLVIAGNKGWGRSKIEQAYQNLNFSNREVIFLGHVEQSSLIKLYCGAKFFALLSLDEGFGFPVLEAMACGIPVICSDIPTLRELAQDAAMYVSPENILDTTKAMAELDNNDEKRTILKEKGLVRAKEFSWLKAGLKILDFLNE